MIDQSRLIEGMIVHVRGRKLWPSRMIRYMLNIARRRELKHGTTKLPDCWGNHDAILIRMCGSHAWYVGDAQPPFAKLTPLSDYEKWIGAGEIDVLWMWPKGAAKEDGQRAALHWIIHINGRPYDYAAYPRLILKCLCGDWIKRASGLTWAFFCTESVRESWLKATHLDPWAGNQTPTPYTTEKRVEDGHIDDWTALVNHI